MADPERRLFAVYAVVKDWPKPLLVTDLPFSRLMDEIIVPYNTDEAFILDGVTVKRDRILQIKVVEEVENFQMAWRNLHYGMRQGEPAKQKTYGEQYDTRLLAVVREGGLDVTSRVLDAYTKEVKPRLRDYVPSKDAILKAAVDVFTSTMQAMR